MSLGAACKVRDHFAKVTDPRVNRGHNHDFLSLIFMALTSTLCGCEGWADVERFVLAKWSWFEKHVSMEQGVPSHDTFGRLFARLDTGEFLTAMHAWVDEFCGSLRGQGIAIDGKTLRGSYDTEKGQSPLHTITAFATSTRLCLRQMSVDEKSNEIPAVPLLLQLLDLTGATVTMDAMHCQVETLQTILDGDADYVIGVKGNQPTLHDHLERRFAECVAADAKATGMKQFRRTERGHGREEFRHYFALPVTHLDEDALARWPGVKSLVMVLRERRFKSGKETQEVSYYISSHEPKVRRLAQHIRGHWAIENSLHYVLDVTFTEDASRIRSDSGPVISGAFRRMALNILRSDTTVKDNMRGKRLRAAWNDDVRDKILAGFAAG